MEENKDREQEQERSPRHTHRDDLQHLCLADVSVPIQVVHAECPLQLLVQSPTRGHAQGDDELPEVDRPVSVGVKRAEDVFGELGGVAVREEVGVDLLELVHGQSATGAVPQEALVPLGDLVLGEVRVVHQVLHDVRTELAVLFAHGRCSGGGCDWGATAAGGLLTAEEEKDRMKRVVRNHLKGPEFFDREEGQGKK